MSKGIDKARETANKLKAETQEEQEKKELAKQEAASSLIPTGLESIYGNAANIGSNNIGAEELRTPTLSIVQKTTKDEILELEGAKAGMFYRSDTQTFHEEVECNILCFDKIMGDNFNQTGKERKHIYYGVYEGSIDPFRLYCRGWSLNGSREFLTQYKMIQQKTGYPMFGLKVTLSTTKESGSFVPEPTPEKPNPQPQSYTTYRILFDILKDENGLPLLEVDPGRAAFLKEKAQFFETLKINTDEDEEITPSQNRSDTSEFGPSIDDYSEPPF